MPDLAEDSGFAPSLGQVSPNRLDCLMSSISLSRSFTVSSRDMVPSVTPLPDLLSKGMDLTSQCFLQNQEAA